MSASPRSLLGTEVSARDSHGGEGRIKAARFPARKTLEEFDFTFQRSRQEDRRRAPRPARLPPRARERDPARPARHRQDPPRDRALDPRLPRRPARAVRDRDPMGRPALRSQTPRQPRGRAAAAVVHPAARRRRGRLHPVRPRSRQPHVQPRLQPLRTRLDDRHQQQALQQPGARSSATTWPPPR